MKRRAVGGNLGLRGDIILNTVMARTFKQLNPDWSLTLGVGPQFADMEPFFRQHPHVSDFHVYHSYDNWPDEVDKKRLNELSFDYVFNGMPPHSRQDWYLHWGQGEEACRMHGMLPPDDGAHCELAQWFDIDSNRDTIAIAPFAGWYNPKNDKRLSVERAQDIVNLIRAKGFKVLQIGGPGEPVLEGASFPTLSYFEAMRAILGCKLLVHTDTGFGWAASAYRFPQLGLYSNAYYTREFVKHIQPINSRALYLDEANVNTISLDSVGQALDTLIHD